MDREDNEKTYQIYDKLLKDIIKNKPPRFFKILTGYEDGRFLDIQFPKVEIRRPDLLVEVDDNLLVHIEIQATVDKSITNRMYEYSALINRQFNRLPKQVLLYVGDKQITTDNKLSSADINYTYQVVEIKKIDSRLLLDSKKPEDFILAILCKTENIDITIKDVVKKISLLPHKTQQNYAFKLIGLSNLNASYNKVKTEVRNMPVTLDVRESPIYLDGKGEGLIEGRQEGLIEGERRGLREGLLVGIETILEVKYGAVGLELMDMVKNINSFERLNQLNTLIKRSATVDEVRANLIGMIKEMK
ncbi:MAG: Yae1 family protein [Nitrospirae bacterium]|nr:Yae1 family protein [Nitrospirota bacterium]